MEHVTLDFRVLRAPHCSGKQEFLDIFQDTENTTDKMLEANPNFERSMTMWPRHKNNVHSKL